MSIFEKRTKIEAPASVVFQWHTRPGALERLTPPWQPMRVIHSSDGIRAGATATMRMKVGPLSIPWIAEHTTYEENNMFRDRQRKGPFAKWIHTHLFEPDGNHSSWMRDHIEYEPPLSALGRVVDHLFIREQLDQIFAYRHRILQDDIAAHQANGWCNRRVLISGASGLVGRALVPFLTTGGHQVTQLVRRPPDPLKKEIFWNPSAGILDPAELNGIDTIVHLAGENIGEGQWTPEKKRRIVESRTQGTALIAKAAAAMQEPPKLLICASAIGYYGNRGECLLQECDLAGTDFISKVCCDWEQAAEPAVAAGIRVVFARIGVALSPAGGALKKLLFPFKMGLGGRIATGSQYMSWISIDDVVGAIHHLMGAETVAGPVNLVAPNPVTNQEFTRALASVLKRPAVFSVPAFAIKMAFGEMGVEIPLSSTRVAPTRLIESGYVFRHPDLFEALAFVLGRHPIMRLL